MRYAWLTWSLLLVGILGGGLLLLRERESRREMFTVSVLTSLFGLNEPIFVPACWTPPSLIGHGYPGVAARRLGARGAGEGKR